MQRAVFSKSNLFLLSIIGLTLVGLAMLSTASAILAAQRTGDSYFYVKRQLLNGVVPGIALFILFSWFPYRKLKPLAFPLMLVCAGLLLLVMVPHFGLSANGATRWLNLGLFSFQPAEILKLIFIIYLAAWFESHQKKTARIREGLVPFLVMTGAVFIPLAWQPDLGTLGVILFTAFSMYFVAGAKITHIALVTLAAAAAVALFVFGFGYGMDRIRIYLEPHSEAQGSGYQILHALAAIQGGGVLGIGFGQSQHRFSGYLPEPMGDSIFSIIAEELGFVGVAAIISLFVFLGIQGFRVANAAPDTFGGLLASGITCWILIQAFVNIGAISGLLPLTGIPLPFMSYGGTSLVVLLAACGIVNNVHMNS